MSRRTTPTRRRTVAALATLLALTAGCTGGSGEPEVVLPTQSPAAGPSSPAPSPATDPYDDPHHQAIDAYLGTQQAFLNATMTADPDHPDLPMYAAGRALVLLRDGLTSIRERGLRGRGEADFQPEVDQWDDLERPTTIIIRDCMDTSGAELYSVSGEPYEDEPGGLQLVRATVEIVDGTWKVTGLGVHGVGTCDR
jgi:hypothetical protein